MIQPLRDLVYIKPFGDPDKTDSGMLYIPEVAKGRSKQGIVKYIGPDVKELKVGHHVVYGAYEGTVIQLGGEGNMIVMKESSVSLIVESVGNIDIPGLYFLDDEGHYWSCTYEIALDLLAEGIAANTNIGSGNWLKKRKGDLFHNSLSSNIVPESGLGKAENEQP